MAVLNDLGVTDPCQLSQGYTFLPIETFEGMNQNPNAPDLAGQYAMFVSSDLTGIPFEYCASGCTFSMTEGQISGLGGCTTGYSTTGQPLPSPRCGTDLNGLHLFTADMTGWGMNVGIELRQDCNGTTDPDAGTLTPPCPSSTCAGLCYQDARDWDGLSFWARMGSDPVLPPNDAGLVSATAPVATTMLVTILDPNTASQLNGKYPFNNQATDHICGDMPCMNGINPPKGPNQCDPFGKAVALSENWQFYAIPFSDMSQKGYGPAEAAPDIAHFLGVKFNISNGQLGATTADAWIDDIALYKAPR